MKITNCMKKNVFAVTGKASISEAATLFVKNHIGSLPVVDDAGRLIGLLQLRDLLELVLPDFVHLLENIDFVGDFGAVEMRIPDQASLALPVYQVMQPAICVDETCGLMRAFSVLHHEEIYDLPIVDAAGHLIGIASRVDIGVLLLSTWTISPMGNT